MQKIAEYFRMPHKSLIEKDLWTKRKSAFSSQFGWLPGHVPHPVWG